MEFFERDARASWGMAMNVFALLYVGEVMGGFKRLHFCFKLILLSALLASVARAQDFSGTHTFSTDVVTWALMFTGAPTTSTVGSSIYF